MQSQARWKQLASTIGSLARVLVFLLFSAGVVVLLLFLAGKFHTKVPVESAGAKGRSIPPGTVIAAVELVETPRFESAVGSVRAVHETSVGSKLLARVIEVNVRSGQAVEAGDVLIRLDDTDIKARLKQAEASLAAARARFDQAAADEKRYSNLVKDRIVSQQEYDRAVATVKATQAEVRRSEEAINEVQALLDWATIRAPMSGVVVEKKVEVGDTVGPGQTLVVLYDPQRMQLVAAVRESLALRLEVGQSIPVRLENLDKECEGTIAEIVPQAAAASRAFDVKVTGPCPPGVYSGMFGRVLIPLENERVIAIPRSAVRHVGQLELVDVVDNGRLVRRAVRIGRSLDDQRVEVLSGLKAGEKVALTEGGPAHE